MKRLLLVTLVVGAFLGEWKSDLAAQDVLRVASMNFSQVANNWVMATLTVEVRGNPSEEAPNRNFLDDVRVDLYLSYEDRAPDAPEQGYLFFRSHARAVTLERGRRDIHFFLPGSVVSRNRLRSEPFAWMVEFQIKGDRVPAQREHFSRNIQSLEGAESLRSRANSEGADNDGILIPIYLLPHHVADNVRVNVNNLPAYFRSVD